jgi:hypothetical protein
MRWRRLLFLSSFESRVASSEFSSAANRTKS